MQEMEKQRTITSHRRDNMVKVPHISTKQKEEEI
jgi:hypothetical protein